jgi:hypothetical protein
MSLSDDDPRREVVSLLLDSDDDDDFLDPSVDGIDVTHSLPSSSSFSSSSSSPLSVKLEGALEEETSDGPTDLTLASVHHFPTYEDLEAFIKKHAAERLK